jgi:hypothetical protein
MTDWSEARARGDRILLVYHTEQLSFQDKFALLVFFTCLVGFIVFPPHGLLTLPADDVTHHMSTCRHAAFHGFSLVDVDDVVEKIGFAVLTTKILPGPDLSITPSQDGCK